MEEDTELLGVGYMRIDRVGDIEETERQSLRILSHCHEHDVKLLAFFLDEGPRGKGWKALEDLVKSGVGLNRVVVAEMDRVSVDVGWLLLKQGEFESRYGVNIVSAGDRVLDLDKENGISKD